MSDRRQQTQLDRIEAMLKELLAMQPIRAGEDLDAFFSAGQAQGKSIRELADEMNQRKASRKTSR